MSHQPVYRKGKIHICSRMCDTCIFRPGNLMRLNAGRVEQMVQDAINADSCIPCHQTLGRRAAVCRGFYERHATWPLRAAKRMGLIEFQDPPK